MIYVRVTQEPCSISEWDAVAEEFIPNSYCKAGDDITDPLLTSEIAARIRGYNEINKSFSNRTQVTGVTKLRDWIAPGSLVSCEDTQIGEYRGLLKSFSITISRDDASSVSATSSVVIEREKE